MEIAVYLILLVVIVIDGKLWKMMAEQQRHNKAMEQIAAEIRDRRP